MTDSRPDSSDGERPVLNREAADSKPARGSTYHYVIVRRELSGGALLAQVLHASGESAAKHALLTKLPLPLDTRGVVLVATKEQLAAAQVVLAEALLPAGPLTVIEETDGPLAGSTTALGFVVVDREFVKPLLAHLKPWRAP